jgi:lipoprotein NlpI
LTKKDDGGIAFVGDSLAHRPSYATFICQLEALQTSSNHSNAMFDKEQVIFLPTTTSLVHGIILIWMDQLLLGRNYLQTDIQSNNI